MRGDQTNRHIIEHPHVIIFFILLLEPALYPAFTLDSIFNRMISTNYSAVTSKSEANEASGKFLGTNKPIP